MRKPPSPVRTFSPLTLAACGLAVLAVGASAGAYYSIARAERRADAVRVQQAVATAIEARALRCLDRATVAPGDFEAAERARRSLNISAGITFCLVNAREDAHLDHAELDACVRALEAENMISDGLASQRPAC